MLWALSILTLIKRVTKVDIKSQTRNQFFQTFISSFLRFSLLRFSVCSIRKYYLYFKIAKFKSKTWKKISFYKEKRLVGLTLGSQFKYTVLWKLAEWKLAEWRFPELLIREKTPRIVNKSENSQKWKIPRMKDSQKHKNRKYCFWICVY